MPFVLEEMGHRRLLFTGNIPRGVFCEWSAAEVTENPRIAARNGGFLPFLCIAKRVTGNGVYSSHRRLLFTGNIPRGVFCEWSAAEVTENPRIAARNGVFLPFLCIAKRVTGNGVYSSHRRNLQAAVGLTLDMSTISDYNEYEIGLSPKRAQGGNGFGGETTK
ncbi:hypothetical protein DWX10_25840 [Clostridium sp. AF18-27]|nr:hypothetical protein DWX10_25840 [Clostridium sp. AF18-27]